MRPSGIAGPDVMRDVRVAVHIVPPRVDEHAVVRDTRLPFVRLVVAEPDDVAAVRIHRVQRVDRAMPAAAQVSAAPFGDERDAAIGQEARIEIVPGAVGQLHQVAAVRVAPEDVVAALRCPLVTLFAADTSPRPGPGCRRTGSSGRQTRLPARETYPYPASAPAADRSARRNSPADCAPAG